MSWRSLACWLLGYPEAALADAEHALKDAREIGHAATLMYALYITALDPYPLRKLCGSKRARSMNLSLWRMKKASRILEGVGNDAARLRIGPDRQSLGRSPNDHLRRSPHIGQREQRLWMPLYLSYLARAYAELGQFDDAWRCIGEAMTAVETTKERWYEAEVNRIAGEIALMSPEPDAAKQKPISSARLRSRERSRQSPGNCAPR